MSEWRVARALIQLREQVNAMFPERSKASDGTIGNAAHASRTSDHNPWVKDGDYGIVTGMDITHDPLHGLDSEHLAEALRTSKDPRLKYVISNRKIAAFDHQNFLWRPYNGANAHNHHCHISVRPDKAHYDDIKPWSFDHIVAPTRLPEKPHVAVQPVLKKGDTGDLVVKLQAKLHILPVDGDFGVETEDRVKEFQQAHGLLPDGKVGPYTWEKIDAQG